MFFRKIFLFVFFFISLMLHLEAQKYDLHTSSKKAKKIFLQAEAVFNTDYEAAIPLLLQALEKDSLFIEAHLLLAEAYNELSKDEEAIKSYEKVIEIDSLFYHVAYFYLAQLYYKNGIYIEAKNNFNAYLIEPNSIVKRNISLKCVENCDFALRAMEKPVPFNPKNLGDIVNSEYPEYFPCLTADNQQLLFTRLVNDQSSLTGKQEDFFIARQKEGVWSEPLRMSFPINTSSNEGAPTLSTDGNILFFTACENMRSYESDRKIIGRCDLFVAIKDGETWLNPYNMGKPVNSRYWESQPSFSSDGKTLYFVCNCDGGYDIYSTEVDDNGIWSEPEKLPDIINTDGYEGFPFIHQDNRTLYFASDGHPGMGMLDIYYSRKDFQGNWTEPVNLGYPINTHHDENSLTITADGKTAYFSSDRLGGYGDLDLYSFELYKEARPQAVTYVKGYVYDNQSKEKLEARFELINLETGETAVRSYSNKGNGEFLVCLPTNRDYALNVSKDGYLFFSENFTLTGKQTSLEPFIMNIPLKKIQKGESVVLKNIFFDTDKYELLEESKIELDKLFDLLKSNASIHIEISGYTDNIGSVEHNIILSENRAKAVYEYLIEKGIDGDRLTFSGYGEKQPVDTNETEKGRANNRRTEFKIL